ncbi:MULTISPECIES: hypothetical protein [Pseudomonas]|uniref:hypothetical protein n=1 Tax=Pseudomonas TaxID=286 RepID=UPI000B035C29|nr:MULTISPECIES: hypothetical protein [Pseudomonas]HDS0981814.1 hypothetical protein [Pseudomonas putida]
MTISISLTNTEADAVRRAQMVMLTLALTELLQGMQKSSAFHLIVLLALPD